MNSCKGQGWVFMETAAVCERQAVRLSTDPCSLDGATAIRQRVRLLSWGGRLACCRVIAAARR
jgi:hypothetical protein